MRIHEVIALLSIGVLIVLSFVSLFFCLFYVCDRKFRNYLNQELKAEICGKERSNQSDKLVLLPYV